MGLHRYTWRTFARELSLLALAVVWWIPFYFLVTMALKPTAEVFTNPLGFPSRLAFGNFSAAWTDSSNPNLGRGLANSIIITGATVVVVVALGSVCAYALARRPGRVSNGLYALFVLGIILPFQLGIVPAYSALRHIHLVGTYAGVILLNTGLLMPLSVFLYTGFVRQLPHEYEEAAQVDGAGPIRTYFRVVFPLLLPVTGTVAILTGMIVWNDFFFALIFLGGTPNATLPVVIYSFVGQYASQWNLIFAAVIVALVPILAFFLIAQKQLIKGFTGGIKG